MHRQQQHYQAVLAKDDLLEAAAGALALAAITSTETSELWRAKHAEHTTKLRQQWCLVSLEGDILPPCFIKIEQYAVMDGIYGCILEDGRAALASTYGRCLLIRLVTPDSTRPDALILLRSPQPLDLPKMWPVDGGLIFCDKRGFLLELQLEPLAIRSFWDFHDKVPQHNDLEGTWVFPSERTLCLNLCLNGSFTDAPTLFFDIDSRKQLRNQNQIDEFSVIHGPTYHLVANNLQSDEHPVFNARGKPIQRFTFGLGSRTERACLHPNGKDFIFANGGGLRPNMEDHKGITLEVPTKQGTIEPYSIEESQILQDHCLIGCVASNLVFVFYTMVDQDRGCRLLALRAQENHFEKVYEVNCPKLFFIKDQNYQRVAAVYKDASMAEHTCLLTQEPPTFQRGVVARAGLVQLPQIMSRYMSCKLAKNIPDSVSLEQAAMMIGDGIEWKFGDVENLKQRCSDFEEAIVMADAFLVVVKPRWALLIWVNVLSPLSSHTTVR